MLVFLFNILFLKQTLNILLCRFQERKNAGEIHGEISRKTGELPKAINNTIVYALKTAETADSRRGLRNHNI